MAARFKKPKSVPETSERVGSSGAYKAEKKPWWKDPKNINKLDPNWSPQPKQEEEEYKLSIQDYIKYSPTIAKELGKESPQILRELIDPVGSVSAEKLSEAINPEIGRALSGSGLQSKRVGSLEMNPKMAALARMIPGATSALTDSNLGSMFSMETANKALQNALGMSKKGISKADLAWLGLFYGRPVKTTKKIFGAARKLIP